MDIHTYPNKDHNSSKEDKLSYELRNGYKVVLPDNLINEEDTDKGE